MGKELRKRNTKRAKKDLGKSRRVGGSGGKVPMSVSMPPLELEYLDKLSRLTGVNRSVILAELLPGPDEMSRFIVSENFEVTSYKQSEDYIDFLKYKIRAKKLESLKHWFVQPGHSVADVVNSLVPSFEVCEAAKAYAKLTDQEFSERSIVDGFIENLIGIMTYDLNRPIGLQIQSRACGGYAGEDSLVILARLFCYYVAAKQQLGNIESTRVVKGDPKQRYIFEQVEIDGIKFWYVISYMDTEGEEYKEKLRKEIVESMESYHNSLTGKPRK